MLVAPSSEPEIMLMNSTFKLAAIFGATAVGIGAFGAHGLKDYLIEIDRLDTFQTAVQYHFYHSLALLGIGVLRERNNSRWLGRATTAMAIGIIIFSGSLYFLCLTQFSILGAITPIGGIAFIAGWLMLLLVGIKKD